MHPGRSALFAFLFTGVSAFAGASAHAQDIYKWLDADGKVHYGDRASAPESSKHINVPAAPRSLPVVTPPAFAAPPRPSPVAAQRDAPKKSVAVPPSRVGPDCKGLIDRIAAVPAGENWQSLAQQFNKACPGIAYECIEFKSSPHNNQCTWIERVDSNMLNTKRYP